ncbi:hypothetical protein D3C84_898920 [compost metagenome]
MGREPAVEICGAHAQRVRPSEKVLSQAMGQRTIEQKTVAQALAFGRLNLGCVLQQPLIRVEQQQVEARERRFLRRIDRDVGWQAPPAFAQW